MRIYHDFFMALKTFDKLELSPLDNVPLEQPPSHRKGYRNILRKTAIFLSSAPGGMLEFYYGTSCFLELANPHLAENTQLFHRICLRIFIKLKFVENLKLK